MTRFRALVFAAASTTGMLASGPSFAQPTGQDQATAQALFDEAKRLMGANKFGEACPKLIESQRLDPAGGTLIALALCHEGEGKTATAWAEFGVALGEARRDRRADREAAALEHIRALEPKLTRLRVLVEKKVDGLEVRRDGALVGEAQWGVALPVDPGDHVFEVRAPKKKTLTRTATVAGAGQTTDVSLPPLEDDASAVVVAPPSKDDRSGPPPPPPDESGRSSRLVVAAVAGGVGLVATGVAVGFSISANGKWSDAHKACPQNQCTSSKDVTLGESAGRAADIATVLYVVGGVGLVAGAVLWLTAPPPSKTTGLRSLSLQPNVSATEAGFSLGGRL